MGRSYARDDHGRFASTGSGGVAGVKKAPFKSGAPVRRGGKTSQESGGFVSVKRGKSSSRGVTSGEAMQGGVRSRRSGSKTSRRR